MGQASCTLAFCEYAAVKWGVMPVLHTGDVLVVPPLEAVWLSGSDFQFTGGSGCLSFEVKGAPNPPQHTARVPFRRAPLPALTAAHPPPRAGDNDATVLLKQQSGSRRWQHLAAGAAPAAPRAAAGAAAAAPAAAAAGGRGSPVEQNYTVILGSHRNSCLKFEKDGELCCMVGGWMGGLGNGWFWWQWQPVAACSWQLGWQGHVPYALHAILADCLPALLS